MIGMTEEDVIDDAEMGGAAVSSSSKTLHFTSRLEAFRLFAQALCRPVSRRLDGSAAVGVVGKNKIDADRCD